MLEELRERKFDGYARKIQKAYRMYKSRQYFAELKQQGKSSIEVLADVHFSGHYMYTSPNLSVH